VGKPWIPLQSRSPAWLEALFVLLSIPYPPVTLLSPVAPFPPAVVIGTVMLGRPLLVLWTVGATEHAVPGPTSGALLSPLPARRRSATGILQNWGW